MEKSSQQEKCMFLQPNIYIMFIANVNDADMKMLFRIIQYKRIRLLCISVTQASWK